ncbi:Glu-tRNA(Gln) amidotransferase GatDE subunit E, partial [Candidatus Woesearchaeota archaeon CG11_big_fil_rev_8_21_14_0_20_57_5]
RIIEQKSDVVRYGLDRLGTPLIEIGTAPDIKSPEHAREVAEKLGLLIRSTGKAKRGIGSIRQDVNVSIPDGKRVEIKGAQELKAIPTLITNEMARQHSLSIIAKELAKRGALGVDATGVNGEEQRDTKKDEKKAGMQGELPTLMEVTSCFAGTECKVIHASGSAWAVRLPRFVGLLGRELIPGTGGRRLGSELSDHAKVAAGVKGLFHSDELPNYGVSDSEVAAVRKALGIAAHNHKDDASCNHAADAFIIVAAPEAQAKRALAAALCRAQLAVVGNVEEVRRANADGTTSFMRWMPGSARMYPETDLGPVVPDLSAVEIPELIEEREARYVSAGVPADLARTLAKDKHELFDHYCKSTSLEPGFIAQLLLTIPKDIKKRLGLDPEKVKQKDFDAVVAALDAGSIAKEAAAEVFCAIIQGTGAADAIASYGQLAEGEVRKRVAAIAAEAGDAPPNALMGMVMKELRGKADGKLIAKIVKELTVPVADATASGAVLQHIDPADPPAPSHSVKKSKAHK